MTRILRAPPQNSGACPAKGRFPDTREACRATTADLLPRMTASGITRLTIERPRCVAGGRRYHSETGSNGFRPQITQIAADKDWKLRR